MAITLPDLTTLNSDAVNQAHAYIAQKITEYAPSIDSKRGVLHDILFHFEAILQTAQDEYADRLRKSGSLLAINNDPTLAVDDVVDQLASNFRAVRFEGSPASGKIVIVISALVPSSVSTSNTFSSLGNTYAPLQSFFARTSADQVVNFNDRLIKPVGDGTYYYVIDAVSTTNSVTANIKRNTSLESDSAIPYFLTAYAESDFSGGSDYESNSDFVKRLQTGISARDLSNRATIESCIKENTSFKTVLDVSTIGFGDPEQIRYHSILPTATGNRLDVYIRSQQLPTSRKITKTATLIGREGGGGLWQVSISRNDVPGFYNIEKIIKATVVDSASETGLGVYEDIRGYDISEDGSSFVPDIVNSKEAAYSPYQTAIIRFIDLETAPGLTEGATAEYSIYARGMNLLQNIQSFLSSRDVRPAGGDVLVKAAIPCDLKLSFTIFKKSTDSNIDESAIKNALANRVNKLGFCGKLSASILQSTIHSYLAQNQTVSAIEMFGAIQKSDLTKKYLRSFESLIIPEDHENMISAKTVVFILSPDDIGIYIKNSDTSLA
jgi:hypothetical protein